MRKGSFLPAAALLLFAVGAAAALSYGRTGDSDRVKTAYQNTAPQLGDDLGREVRLRIIKEKRVLELWVERAEGWALKKNYPILAMSGSLGPKTKEGDMQAPEGFYEVRLGSLNPKSSYHLSFNIGYPNAYDRSLGRTGSFIMVHGGAVSIGCFALGDPAIEELYTMVHAALQAGQDSVPVHIYPFEMTAERMEAEKESPHYDFWCYLQKRWGDENSSFLKRQSAGLM